MIKSNLSRKIDMLNYDAIEEDEYGKRFKKAKPKRTGSRPKKAAMDDSAFHFVSYMPIQREIWRLDGLDENPQKLGPCGPDNWLDLIIPMLQARMGNDLQFNLLALIRDPYAAAIDRLAYNIRFHAAIESRLAYITEDWRAFADELPADFITYINETYGITDSILERTEVSQTDKARLQKYDEADGLLQLRRKNANEQETLRVTLVAEKASTEHDEEKAKDRRNDYGPLIQRWLMMLADNGRLRELHE
jgi:ubiquitin carboxyl-terminal hydrolase L5